MADYYFLILGLFLGSFIHTLSFRISNNVNIYQRSYCESCKQPISPIGLIPIIGYIVQKGICRNCHAKIPVKYPLLELLNGLLVWFIYYKVGLESNLIFEIIIWECLFFIALFDFQTMLILWMPVFVCFAARSVMIYLLEPAALIDSLTGMFVSAGIFHFISYFYYVIRGRVGLGEGDATLIGLLGFILTWEPMVAVIFMASVSGIFMICGMALVRKMSLKEAFPFGPALILGAFIFRFLPEVTNALSFFQIRLLLGSLF